MKQKKIMTGNRTAVNLICGVVSFALNYCISFFLSPYIIETIGVEANGYINLATNFVNYATLITIALNSMASRFITIEYHKGNIKKANQYYTSVFVGNLAIVLILILPAIFLLIFLEQVISIPQDLLWDTKILFGLTFLNFFISTGVPSWACATYVTNTLYLESFRDMESNIIRVVTIVLAFALFTPHVFYVSLAATIVTIYKTCYAYYYKKRLMKDVVIKKEYYSFSAMKTLVSSGIWNTISSLGLTLTTGLDLLIANIFVGSTEMGVLSVAKTVPSLITNLGNTITRIFVPSLTINYAKGDKAAIKKDLKTGMKITGIILTIPVSVLIVLGSDFYRLWVPSQDAKLIQVLSILTCFQLIFTSGIRCLFNVFTVTNKLRTNSLLLILEGAVSVVIVYILLKTTNLGIYAVASVSTILSVFLHMFYTVPFASKYLGFKWYTFYPEVGYSVLSVATVTAVGYFITHFIEINTWIKFILISGMLCIIGIIINSFIVLNKEDRKLLIGTVKEKIRKKL